MTMDAGMYALVVRACPLRRVFVLSLFAPAAMDGRRACRGVTLGVPPGSSLVFRDALILGNDEMSVLLGIGKSRLAAVSKPDAESRKRLTRCARLFVGALDALGNREAAVRWLKSPQPELGDSFPLLLAQTDPGAGLAQAMLRRKRPAIS
jgi:antitoxin Xre/MbcA/ParS-like protein